MKRVATLTILTGILVGGTVFALRLISIPKVQAQDSCTIATFQGAFGYTFTGLTGFNALPFAAVGRLVADGQGNLTGAETDSSNGNIFQRTYTGTYKVNSEQLTRDAAIPVAGLWTSAMFPVFTVEVRVFPWPPQGDGSR